MANPFHLVEEPPCVSKEHLTRNQTMSAGSSLQDSLFFFFNLIFFRAELIYSVVPISAIWHGDTVIGIHTFYLYLYSTAYR